MDASLLIVIFAAVALAGFVFWLLMLIDALKTPASVWERAGQNQIVYIVVIVVLGFIGALVYALVARPQLRAVQVG